ncbi:MAG: outer spore coat protein CotE [Candidatus Pristimantibacillus lignocellulolyticus]|uniref:Outer spore coat protein CotE n=1 Tax=Candidatus Pristimantibacillus lignocellulolyticus TaxID=2994561 RepID=A0A9J6ZDS1_9BACL|nr:MAG: outer spore coat protein CotE [Candidatus Pristimantibacillus lignocellulolyticus]
MARANKQLRCREIITKAVCGKGRKFSTSTHTVTPPHRPTSILGAWVINTKYEAVKAGNGVEVIGTYDINIWYSYNNNSQTDVAKESVQFVENVPLYFLDPKHRVSTTEVYAESVTEPNCIEANISANGDSVQVRVEREFVVEMIAETKVSVAVVPNGCPDPDGKDFDQDDNDAEDDFDDLDLLDGDV